MTEPKPDAPIASAPQRWRPWLVWVCLPMVLLLAAGYAVLHVGHPERTPSAPETIPTTPGFVLSSSEVADGQTLPKDFTGDGSGATLPLEWKGTPEGTKSFAVIMHHIPGPGDSKWYWVLHNIPADVRSLARNVQGVGTLGNNSVNGRTEYAPPHSKGPGPKEYIYTVYALSAPPQLALPPEQVSREVLRNAMKGLILGRAELHVVYTRY